MTGVGSPSVTPVAEAQSQAAPPASGRHRIGLIIWLNLAIFFLWQGSIHRLLPYPELDRKSVV